MISDRVFPNGNRFFIQENYRRSRMGKGIIVLDWEIGILDMKYTFSDLQIEIPTYVCSYHF